MLLFKGPDAQSVLRRTTMDHENWEAQQISALELQLKSNFRPGLRFPSYLYDFSASKFQICDRNLGFSAIFLVHAPIFGCRFKHVSRNCPYKCPKTLRLTCLFGSGMTVYTTVMTQMGLWKTLNCNRKSTHIENQIELLHPDCVSGIVAFHASPCFFWRRKWGELFRS